MSPVTPMTVGYSLHHRVLLERYGKIPATLPKAEAREVHAELERRRRSDEFEPHVRQP